MKKIRTLLVLLALATTLNGAYALPTGGGAGNAGNFFGLYYSQLAKIGLDRLMQTAPESLSTYQIYAVQDAIATSRVDVTNQRICYGRDDDQCEPVNSLIATNNPEKKTIRVNPAKFFPLEVSLRPVFALHEYLGLVNAESYGTPISNHAELDSAGIQAFQNAPIAYQITMNVDQVFAALGLAPTPGYRPFIQDANLVCNALGLESGSVATVNDHLSYASSIQVSQLDGTLSTSLLTGTITSITGLTCSTKLPVLRK